MTVEEVVEVLNRGEIVALPTDTVIGLIALPTKDNAEKIYKIKKRERKKPIGLFLSEATILKELLSVDFHEIEDLTTFWPGALTLVLPVKNDIFPFLQKNGKLGFRIPHYPLLLKVLKKTGILLQTSANISGEPTPNSSEELKGVFNEKVHIIKGKSQKLSSTVLEYQDSKWIALRKGSIPIVKIKKKTNKQIVVLDEFNVLFVCTGNIERSPMGEAILRTIVRDLPVNIKSRGILKGGIPYSKTAQKAIEKLGYEKIEGVSRQLTEEDLKWADLVLAMEGKHIEFIKEKFPQFSDKAYLLYNNDIPDPIGLGEKTHELVANIIESAIKNRWLDFIKSFFQRR